MAHDEHAHDNHGRTPANWTGATIITLGFILGTVGVIVAQPIIFWASVVVIVVGAVLWKVMLGMESSSEDAG
jgi:hypothetical protein